MVDVDFLIEGRISLCRREVINDIGGGGDQNLTVLMAGSSGEDFGEHGFAGAGVADEDDIFFLGEEVEVDERERMVAFCSCREL